MIAKQKALNLKAFEEVPPGFEPGIEVLQTFALPLGYSAIISATTYLPRRLPTKYHQPFRS